MTVTSHLVTYIDPPIVSQSGVTHTAVQSTRQQPPSEAKEKTIIASQREQRQTRWQDSLFHLLFLTSIPHGAELAGHLSGLQECFVDRYS